MNDKYFEETIGQIYDLVEGAKTSSFNKDKVVLDKNQILKDAAEKARKLVSEQEIYQEAKARANEMVRSAQQKAAEVNKAAIEFMDESLKTTEETIAQALSDVRNTRAQFRAIRGGSSNKANSAIIEDI